MDVAAGRQIHDRVGAPADRPHHLLHLFLHRGGNGGVADVGVDLHQEVSADDHRLEFGVVDVGRDDGAARGHFLAHELRRDERRQRRAEAFAVGQPRLGLVEHRPAAEVFAGRDVDHLLGDHTGARPFELRDRLAVEAAQRPQGVGKRPQHRFLNVAVVDRLDDAAGIFLDATTRHDPGATRLGEALAHVDRDARVGVRACRIVDAHRRLGRRRQLDLAQGNPQVRRGVRRCVDLAG